MRQSRPITKNTILNAIDFVSEKSGTPISTVEICYVVAKSGKNTISGFNFQDERLKIRLLAGGTESFVRQFRLTGDRTMTIYTPVQDTKLVYTFCSTNWSFEKEVAYQESKGNRLESKFGQQAVAQFENTVFCDIQVGYTSVNEDQEQFDMRDTAPEHQRMFDLISVIDRLEELDKIEPRYQFGRQRFTVNQFIDYLCKKD